MKHPLLATTQTDARSSATRATGGRGVLTAGALAVVWSALGLAFTARPAPEAPPAQAGPSGTPTVTVRFVAQATATTGATGGARARSQGDAAEGGHVSGHLVAGTPAHPSLCLLGTTAPTDADPALVWWQMAATIRAVDPDGVVLTLEWHRDGLAPIGSAGSAGPGELRLREGQSHVVDAVFDSPGRTTGCSNVLVSVEVAVNRPADEAIALLEYQITLITDRGGIRAVSPRLDLVGRPAEAVPFRFRPVRWPIAANDTTDGPPPVEMDIFGDLSAVLRRDGQVDITANVARRLMLGLFHQGSGTLVFPAHLGEEVRVVLPPPTGSSLLPWSDPRAQRRSFRPGVEAERDGIRVHYEPFLSEVETSLQIRVVRIQ